MIGRLYINEVEVDLSGSIPFPITYSISDVKNPESRKRSRSKTVDLPGTQKNQQLFSSTFQLTLSPNFDIDSTVNFDPSARTVARYERNGLVVFDGLMKLNKVVLKDGNYTFNITLYSNIVNIIRDLADLKVSELDWSIYNHKLNRSTVEKSWNEEVNVITDGSGDPDNGTFEDNFSGTPETGFSNGPPEGWGYVYPVAEYGYPRDAQNRFKTSDLIPYVYLRECIHKVFDEQFELTVVSDFMDTDLFRRFVLGKSPGKKFELTDQDLLERKVEYESEVERTEDLIFPASTPALLDNSNPLIAGPSGSHPDWPWDYTYYYEKSISVPFLRDEAANTLTLVTDDLNQVDTDTGLITMQRSGNFTFTFAGTLRARMEFDDPESVGMVYSGGLSGAMLSVGVGNRQLRLAIYKNGSLLNIYGGGNAGGAGIQINNLNPGGDSNSTWVDFTFDKQVTLDLQVGDVIDMRYEFFTKTTLQYSVASTYPDPAPNPVDPSSFTFELDTTDGVDIIVEANDVTLDDDEPVVLSRFVTDMKCSDLIQGTILAFNLYVDDPDVIDQTIRMEPLEDYYQEDSEAIDWTDKVDYSKRFEILPASTIQGKTYAFKFKEDGDYDNTRYRGSWGIGYGDREYLVPSTFLTGEKEFQLPFACSVPVRLRSVDTSDVTSIIAPRMIEGSPVLGDAEPYKGSPRLYVYNGLVDLPDDPQEYFRLTNVSDPNTGGNFEDFTYYPNINHQNSLTAPTFDLMWASARDYWETFNGVISNNNLWFYHGKFIRELTQSASALVRCYIRLSESDIYSLDFGRLIKVGGVLYRLNEIKDWDPNVYQSAQVELLKVIELSNVNTG